MNPIEFITDIYQNHHMSAHGITLVSGFLVKILYDVLVKYFSSIKRHNDEGKNILRILLENNFDVVNADFVKAINAIDIVFTNNNKHDNEVLLAKSEYMAFLNTKRNKDWQQNRIKYFRKLIVAISIATGIKNTIPYIKSYSP